MLFFINSEGRVVGQTPGGLTQGSSKANVLQVVAPFPTAVLTVSFQLPNRIVLGPYVEDGSAPADEYTMTRAFEIEGFNVGGTPLTVYTYTCSRELTALSGELGIQFFITVGEGTRDPENVTEFVPTVDDIGGYTIAVPMVSVPVYSGTMFIPSTTINTDNVDTIEQILELVSLIKSTAQDASDAAQAAETALESAVLKNLPSTAVQSINGSLSISDLQARDVSALSMDVDQDMLVGGNTFTDSLNVAGDATFGEDVSIDGSVSIGEHLFVKGTTYTVNQQTVIAKDNIIVTNAVDGASFTASGLVINKGNGTAYGILYMPEGDAGDAVYIGEGTLTVTEDANGNVTDVKFEYGNGQALPLAARSGAFEEGAIPVWYAEKNAFKSSGITVDDIGDINTALAAIQEQINGVEETLSEINDGGIV